MSNSAKLDAQVSTLRRVMIEPGWVKSWEAAIDGGAFHGLWSKTMAPDFARVIAFEASPENFRRARTELAGLPNVELHNQALFSTAGTVKILEDEKGHPCARHVSPSDGGEVEAVTIDSLRLESCGLIKLDLEGAEIDGLIGARATIRRCRPALIIEVKKGFGLRHGWPDGTVDAILEHWGYERAYQSKPDVVFLHRGAM